MTRKERRELQEALHFEGVYEGAIDADFGPGTRRAMRAWQRDAGVAPTGILTSRQRARIVKTYRQAFAELGLETVRDEDAGIAVTLPTKLVEFDRYAPPFAHYDAADGSGVRVLLISQNGDHDTLTGLFQVMQTLEIVPTSGKRSKRGTSFFIEGRNARLQSYTFAALRGGRIKGFTLAWPPDRAKIMSEAVGIMRESFQRIGDTTLDDSRAPPAPQRDLDTISGLAVRRPEISRTGFYVDAAGTVVTTSEVLSRCARLTVGAGHEARIAARDPALGLAVLRPRQTLAPIGYARFAEGAPRLRTEVAVAGFSYGAVLDLPTLTFGQLAALRGLDGDEVLQRLDLAALPGDRGGPVFDSSGAVLGALVAPVGENRQLPRNVSFAARAAEIAKLLEGSGTSVARADGGEKLAPRELTARAADMTVPVSCWN